MRMKSCLFFLSFVFFVCGDLDSHQYQEGEKVFLWMNRVGPYQNPSEVYKYYSLPYCQPDKMIESTHETIGEALLSYDLILSPVEIRFLENSEECVLCTRVGLTREEAALFRYAIRHQYWFQLFLDDLPMWGMVGEMVDDKAMLYTKKDLLLTYNNGQIITVNLTMDKMVEVKEGADITFTYAIKWEKTDISFQDRFNVYLENSFFEHQIHWFSILNSFMMLVFLIGLVALILIRTLRNDYARFALDQEKGKEKQKEREREREGGEREREREEEERGWELLRSDVFRSPLFLSLFTSFIGTGHQLFFLFIFVLLLSFWGTFYVETRGSITTALIVSYALTSFIAGYSSGGYYSRNSGKQWIRGMFLTGSLFPSICLLSSLFLNFVAFIYESDAIIQPSSLLILVGIWIFISLPLVFLGTILGRNWSGEPINNPFQVSKSPRPIPNRSWYLQPFGYIILGGILPFGSIFIEMYFIFASFWHYKHYHLYGFLILVFVILICVTVCVTIVSTYFLLNAEDHRWKWTAFLSAGSTALYVYGYAIYYYFTKTKMTGFFQTTFYFTYTALFCIALFFVCGTIGFVGSSVFVKRIYRNVKKD